ncbi:hypothetical protein SpCBS45565_g01821 [Spizellomyces sp. 'palustris']|nr:hypothetical protein SpCBS45565_g01821 [Spizellomyces sp. 'palustris']
MSFRNQLSDPAKPLLNLTPTDLFFTPTRSNIGVIAKVTIQNPGKRAVGYKLKTNAPARYSVKPVLGVLVGGGSVDVLVRSESDIQPNDRFLLQTVHLSDEETKGLDAIKWRTLDRRRFVEIFIDCKRVSESIQIKHFLSSTITASSPTITSPQHPSQVLTKSDTVRVTPLDVVVFTCLCLVLGILMPYRSLLGLVEIVSF